MKNKQKIIAFSPKSSTPPHIKKDIQIYFPTMI